MTTRIPLAIFVVMSVFFVFPIGFIIYGSIAPGFTSYNFTLQFLIQVITAPNTPTLLFNTLEYGIGSAILGVSVATLYAWLMERTDVPGKRLLRFLPILPLTVPFLVKAFGWLFLFSPTIGLVNLFFQDVFGPEVIPFNIFSMAGLIFVTGIGGVPLAYLMIEAGLKSMEPSLEESAQICGSGAWETLRRVTLPIMLPTLLTAFILEIIVAVELFDYVFILGTPVYIQTLATWVFNLMDVTLEYSLAAAYGLIYLIITGMLITLYVWSVRRSYRFVTVAGKGFRRKLFEIGRWRWVGLAYCTSVMFVGFILPVAIIFLVSFVPFYTVAPGVNPFARFTLNNYINAFKVPGFWDSVTNSFELSIGSALLTTLLATIMAYAAIKTKSRFRGILEYLSALPLSFPGVVYAVGLIWMFLVLPGLNLLYGTTWIMLIALVVVWLPYAIRFVGNNLIQISNELEEAASVAGSRWTRSFARILVPLLKGGISNSLVYVFVDSFRELGAVVLLTTANSQVLTVLILSLFQANASKLPVVAALSTLMTIMLTLSVIVIRLLTRQRLRAEVGPPGPKGGGSSFQ